MIEIVAIVCSLQYPEQCKDLRLSFAAENATPFQCFHYGQMELAKWKEGHPDWRVAKFKCGRVGQFAKA